MSHGNRRRFRLIGLTGAAGSGKDTVAQGLAEMRFVQYALANPIKRALNTIFGWTMEQWENREWKEAVIERLGFSPRRAAQTLGTEWGRSLHESLWLALAGDVLKFYDNAMLIGDKYQREHPEEEVVPQYIGMVVSDVRFENEARWVRENGGEIWHIKRPGIASVAAHASEAGVARQHGDVELLNTGTIDGIKQAAKIIVRGGE